MQFFKPHELLELGAERFAERASGSGSTAVAGAQVASTPSDPRAVFLSHTSRCRTMRKWPSLPATKALPGVPRKAPLCPYLRHESPYEAIFALGWRTAGSASQKRIAVLTCPPPPHYHHLHRPSPVLSPRATPLHTPPPVIWDLSETLLWLYRTERLIAQWAGRAEARRMCTRGTNCSPNRQGPLAMS